MDLKQALTKSVVIKFLTLTQALTPTYAMMPITYQSPMGAENWKMTGNRLRCGLSITIPEYGVAYFEQYAAKPAHFVLDKWQKVTQNRPLTVDAMPPVWKPGLRRTTITRAILTPGEYGVYLRQGTTQKILNYLSQGYVASMRYRSEEGTATALILSPIRFKAMYAKYVRCVGNLLPFDFETVKSSTFHFTIDSSELSDTDKAQLNRIALYCKADKAIKYVKIAGFTDDTGRKSYNNAISSFRAKAVSTYLQAQGLQARRLKVTWFGLKDPILPNNTDEGRAANRRVEVKLYQ